jgi:hypothetical protein
MTPDEKAPLTFELREMLCQDADGRQFVMRVNEHGEVVFARVFDQRGEEVPLKDDDKISLSVAIRNPKKKKDVLAARVCMCPYQVGGVTYYFPC